MSILAHGLRAAAGNIAEGLTLVDTYGFSDVDITSFPITIPVEENDLVLFLHADASTTAGSLSLNVTDIDLATTSNGQNATRLSYYVVASGVSSITMNDGSVDGGIAMVFRGADVSTAPQYSVADSASGNADPASITATINPEDYVAVLVGYDRNVTITGYPSGYDVQYSSQDDIAVAGVTKTDITASSEDPGTFTNTSDGWGVYTVLVKTLGLNYEADFGTPDFTITTIPSSTAGGTSNPYDTLIAIDLTVGSDNGILMELGGTGTGLSIGVNDDTLRFRAYAGGTAWESIDDTATAFFEVDISAYTGTFCTYYFTVDASISTAKAYVQVGGQGSVNELIELATDTPSSAGSNIYGTAGKGYGEVNLNAPDLGTGYMSSFSGTINEIRYWAEDAAFDVSTFGTL